MLYINYGNSEKRLYINVKAIGKILLGVGYFLAYAYLSNQALLTILGK